MADDSRSSHILHIPRQNTSDAKQFSEDFEFELGVMMLKGNLESLTEILREYKTKLAELKETFEE